MTQKENCPGAATPEQMEMEGFGEASVSKINYSTFRELISSILSTGQENAIPRRELEAMTGLDGRTIRLMIERERRNGALILSDCQRGYFLAGSETEKQIFVRSMRARAMEILKTVACVEHGVV